MVHCIWNGTFATWDEAAESAHECSSLTSQAFDSGRWLDKQAELLALARQGVMARHTCLPILVAASQSRTIVDFGGGSGWTYEIVRRSVAHEICSYQVIEQPTTVEVFAESYLGEGSLNFLSTADISPSVESCIDVLYSNSALQYLATDGPFLEVVSRNNPRWLLIDDYQNAEGVEFFTTQFYYGARIPSRFMNVDLLRRQLLALGYSMKGQWPYPASFGGNLRAELGNVTLKNCNRVAPTSLLFERDREGSPPVWGDGEDSVVMGQIMEVKN